MKIRNRQLNFRRHICCGFHRVAICVVIAASLRMYSLPVWAAGEGIKFPELGQERVNAIDGKLSDLTHLQGTKTDQSYGPQDYATKQQTHTISWDVSWLAK